MTHATPSFLPRVLPLLAGLIAPAASFAKKAEAPVAAASAQAVPVASASSWQDLALAVGVCVVGLLLAVVAFKLGMRLLRIAVALVLAPFSVLRPPPTIRYFNAPVERQADLASRLAQMRSAPSRCQYFLCLGDPSIRQRVDARLQASGGMTSGAYHVSPRRFAKTHADCAPEAKPGYHGVHLGALHFRREYLGFLGRLRSNFRHFADRDHVVHLFAGGTPEDVAAIAADVNRTVDRLALQGFYGQAPLRRFHPGGRTTLRSRAMFGQATGSASAHVSKWHQATHAATALGDPMLMAAVAAGTLPAAMNFDTLTAMAQALPSFTEADPHPYGAINPTTGLPMMDHSMVDVSGTVYATEPAHHEPF